MTVYGGAFGRRQQPPSFSFGSSLEKLVAAREAFGDLLHHLGEVEMMEDRGSSRQRVRFSMTTCPASSRVCYSMFDGSAPAAVAGFDLASPRINALMPSVLREVRSSSLGDCDLRAVHFHAPLYALGEPVVTLVYGSPIPDAERWLRDAGAARANLVAEDAVAEDAVHFVGRCKGATLVSDRDVVREQVLGAILEFPEGSFSHPNTRANERSVEWLRGRLEAIGCGGPCYKRKRPLLLELYCGAGNHTTCLAASCAEILAVEIDKRLVDAARRNLKRNDVRNATVLAADAGRFSKQRYRRQRRTTKSGRRRRQRPPPMTQQEDEEDEEEADDKTMDDKTMDDFDVILVDPPRRGLDRWTRDAIRHFPHVLYVSCNPTALLDDLRDLRASHDVAAAAFLDAFPQTPHLECLVHLVRRITS